jgi:16S rRNA processing protein RimM
MEYVQIGFTKKAHGIQGELKVAIEPAFEDLFLEADRILIEIKGTRMPFFIQEVRGGGEWIVQFEDVKDRNAAIAIQSKPILLPAAEVPATVIAESNESELVYGFLVGYTLHDKHAGLIGPVEDVLDMPQQEMAQLTWQQRMVLIPLNESLIISINKAQKSITVDLPEGLLDL